jgi:hypothetical protein
MRTGTIGSMAAALAFTALGSSAHLDEARAAGGYVPCTAASFRSVDVVTHPACARILPSGALRLAPGRLDQLRFDEDGLASVQVGKLFFYVNEHGKTAPVAGVDGRATTFHDGLAPSPRRVGRGYKIGYIDKDLSLAIPARWDGGLDFDGGRAEVCRGCHVARDGDFAELQGGLWGCIDTDGREVVPVREPSPDNLDCGG